MTLKTGQIVQEKDMLNTVISIDSTSFNRTF